MRDLFVTFLSDFQGGMSQFQDDYLVTVRAGLTDYGQYKQALREMMTRVRSLKQAYEDMELLRVDMDEWQHELSRLALGEFERRRHEIKLNGAKIDLVFIEKRISELEAEFSRFWQQAQVLKEKVGDLDPDKRRALEADYWKHLLLERYVIQQGRVDDKLLRDVAAMPGDVRAELLEAFCAPYVDVKQSYLEKADDWLEALSLPDGRMGRAEILALLDELRIKPLMSLESGEKTEK